MHGTRESPGARGWSTEITTFMPIAANDTKITSFQQKEPGEWARVAAWRGGAANSIEVLRALHHPNPPLSTTALAARFVYNTDRLGGSD